MKAIQEELGGAGSEKEIDEMRNQASKKIEDAAYL